MDERILEEIGLTKGEISVYRALLKTGAASTGVILKNAHISGGKVYQILERLIFKGLVSFVIKNNIKYFQAASPNRLLDFYNQKNREFKAKETLLKKEVESLLTLKIPESSSVVLFSGLKGIETAIFEALRDLKQKDTALAMGVRFSKDEKFNLLWEKWHSLRIKRKIYCQMLLSERLKSSLTSLKLTKIRFLSGVTPSAITILGERVLIQTYDEEPCCVSIKNKGIVKSFTTFFETLWSISESI